MNTLDIIILIPLAYFAFRGFTRGFIITLAMLAGLMLGLFAAIHFSEYTAVALHDNLHMQSSNIRVISYLVTFVIVLVLVFLLGQFLTKVVKTAGLGLVNRLAGLLLGVSKGLLIASVFVVVLGKIDPKSYLIPEKTRQESILYPPVSAIAPKIFPVMEQYTLKAKELIIGKETGKP
jgi:membrane protein required for colicin V production